MKLLVITYRWPPSAQVGAVRPSRIAASLAQSGWEVHALSARAENGRSVVYDRPPSLVRATALPQANRAMWPLAAVRAGSRLIRAHGIEAVLSSSPLEGAHWSAAILSRQHRIPWVADLRDLWSLDHYRPFSEWKRRLLGVVERSLLRRASAVVTVSEGMAEAERQLLGPGAPEIRVIPNGYDPDEWSVHYPAAPPGAGLYLVYAGKLHPDYQDPRPFFEGLRMFLEHRPARNVRAEFFLTGYRRPDVIDQARRCGLPDGVVIVRPPLVRSELTRVMSGCSALLIFPWQGPYGDGWVPMKLFDCFGARRPALVVGAKISGALERMVGETRLGACLRSSQDVAQFLEQHERVLETLTWGCDEERTVAFSFPAQARRFADVLESARRPA